MLTLYLAQIGVMVYGGLTHLARNLEQQAGVAPQDVFIFMHENDHSDWSVGHGRFAMELVQQRGGD